MIPDKEVKIASREDLKIIRNLALKIFPFTYKEIVTPVQIDYMMEMIYTTEALQAQQDAGQVFLIMYYIGIPVGFAAFSKTNDIGDYKLNKIYLDHTIQGKGLGKWLLHDVIYRVKSAGGQKLTLNVNKNNKAKGFYQNMGFAIARAELLDIGSGHFMDDYVMELAISG